MTFAMCNGSAPRPVPAEELPQGPTIETQQPESGRYRGLLSPGDSLVASVGAGAQVELRAAGEHAS
eukprot:8192119-Lingulodinium_polyedra.AAC.1